VPEQALHGHLQITPQALAIPHQLQMGHPMCMAVAVAMVVGRWFALADGAECQAPAKHSDTCAPHPSVEEFRGLLLVGVHRPSHIQPQAGHADESEDYPGRGQRTVDWQNGAPTQTRGEVLNGSVRDHLPRHRASGHTGVILLVGAAKVSHTGRRGGCIDIDGFGINLGPGGIHQATNHGSAQQRPRPTPITVAMPVVPPIAPPVVPSMMPSVVPPRPARSVADLGDHRLGLRWDGACQCGSGENGGEMCFHDNPWQ